MDRISLRRGIRSRSILTKLKTFLLKAVQSDWIFGDDIARFLLNVAQCEQT